MVPYRAVRPWALALAGLLLLTTVAGLTSGGVELSVALIDTGEELWSALLEPDERFTLRYIHSVDRTPIWEVHSIDANGDIFVEVERFVMIGAGMGDLPGRGRWTGADGLQAIEDLHYRVGEFVLRVGSVGVDHTLLWRGTETNLSKLAAGEAVLISGRGVSQLHRIWRHLVPHPATPQLGADHD